MKIIDDKGKIFGIINYLDLMAILVVALLAVNFFVLDNEKNSKELIQSKADREILLTFNISGIKDISVNSVKKGDIFREVPTGNVLGEVVKVEVKNQKIATTDRDGNVVYSDVPDRYDMLVTLKAMANETEKSIKVSNLEVQIGRTMTIESKLIRFESVIYGIE